MSSRTQASTAIKLKSKGYDNFKGLDTSRSETSQEVKGGLPLTVLNNAFCDWRGQITRAAAGTHRNGLYPVVHAKFLDRDVLTWAERRGGAIYLTSDNEDGNGSHTIEAYPTTAVLSSTHFNNKVHYAAQALPMFSYDGTSFAQNQSFALNNFLKPAYVCSVQRRMVVAGILGREQEVHLSRVDNEEVMPEDEDPASADVERGGTISVRNLSGVAGRVTGIAPFEQTKLAIFTEDRAFVYTVDPDIDKWFLDDRANINIGCLSHNTIVPAGSDLLYCSRSGVHSVRRSDENGIMIDSQHFSDRINEIYRYFLSRVEDPSTISAAFDQDKRQYNIYFPEPGGFLWKSLCLTMNPEAGGEIRWSTADYLNASCGTFYGGNYIVGTSGGVYNIGDYETNLDEYIPVKANIETPILWMDDMVNTKQGHSWVMMASGPGELQVTALNEEDDILGSWNMEVSGEDDGTFFGVPLFNQYQRKFDARFRGVKFRFETESKGLVRIVGIMINTR